MKSKPRSITSDTRLTQSGIFNNSYLNQTNHNNNNNNNNNYLSHGIQQFENKQNDFLKIKNHQLQQKLIRMIDKINELQKNKEQLLGINNKYVEIINQYYCKKSEIKIHFKNNDKSKFVLQQLEKDHRNLVKHCLAMEKQIKKYTQEMAIFNNMKQQLKLVNHTSVKQLVQELRILALDNKQLKKQNNRITFQLQKSKKQCKNLIKQKDENQLKNGNNQGQIEQMKCQINTKKQQNIDHTNYYEAKIYDLQLKVNKLQNDLRNGQKLNQQNEKQKNILQMQRIQNIYQCTKLKKNMVQILSHHPNKNNKYLELNEKKKTLSKYKNQIKGLLSQSEIL